MKFYSVIGIILIVGVGIINPVSAQRRKKNTEPKSQPAREREAEFYFTEGEKYFILEDYAKALLYYQKSLDVNPENATAYYKIAEVLSSGEKQEDKLKASVSIQTALGLEKKNKYFYLLAVNIYSSLGEFDKAIQAYETLMAEVPGTESYLYELAALYQYNKKTTDAIKVYDRAEAVLGINEVSSIQKMKLYFESNKNKEAILEGEKIIDAFPDEERYVMAFAEVLSQQGLQEEGIKHLNNFINENKRASQSKILLAGIYRDLNEEQKARDLLTEVFNDPTVEFNSKLMIIGTYNAELSNNKARGIQDLGKENFVISLFKKLKEHYPYENDINVLGGDLYLTLNQNEAAIQEYTLALKTDPSSFEVWQNLLYLEIKMHRFDQAVIHSEEALELFPNQSMFYYFNGYANLQKKQFRNATGALEQAKKLNRNDKKILEEINNMLGEAYNALKDYPKSDKSYDDALAINPENKIVLNNYSYYLALRKDNLEKAERMSAQLIKLSPTNATYLDTYSWVLFMSKKYKEAKKIIEKAIETGKANTTHFEHYGDILFKLGDINGAVEQWEKAKSLDTDNEILDKKIANRKIYE